ncbi:methionine--tRNA ligase [Patescibacteria group bacterium]|nr:MAG: methionine--tRNA ligase [Patescibacteria group bacterium]
MKPFYITTPIYYVNGRPHIGHAYTTFAADTLARYWRQRGHEVVFLCGTDENSQKNVEAAHKEGERDIQKFVDRMSAVWQETWDSLGISHDVFVRTTSPEHKKAVTALAAKVWEAGDIYKGVYEGLYCVGCEAFLTDSDLENGLCSIHRLPPKPIKEENYFFRLSKYRGRLLDHIEAHPKFIQPESRRNELTHYIANAMADISITRQSAEWGIPLPQDSSQAIYVWFDALINYLTGVGYGSDEKRFKKTWPADLHLVGKDIIKFHCALWPAMLISVGLPLPERVFAHGYFTVNGQKMGKSAGNDIDPTALAKEWGIDALRYFLLREIPFGEDGDFSLERFKERYEGDLANGLGNFAARVLAMTEKYLDGRVPEVVSAPVEDLWTAFNDAVEKLAFDEALRLIWLRIGECDRLINTEEPWVLAKTDKTRLERVLYILLENLRQVSLMLWPIMPETSEQILARLGVLAIEKSEPLSERRVWGGLKPGTKVKKGDILFPKKS